MSFVNVLFGSIFEKHTFLILVDLADGNGGIIMVPFQIQLLRDGVLAPKDTVEAQLGKTPVRNTVTPPALYRSNF